MRIEAGIQQEILKLDRLSQLGNGMDAVRGAETIFAGNNNKPFHVGVFDPYEGHTVFRAVDHDVVQMMKGTLSGIYRELVSEGNKGAADLIVKKHI